MVVGVVTNVFRPGATHDVDDNAVDGFVELYHQQRRAEAFLVEIREEVARETFTRVDSHVANVFKVSVKLETK